MNHLWEYNYYNETAKAFYPGRPSVKKPMPIGRALNLNSLNK